MYGPRTKVSVDYYSSHMEGGHDLLRDFVQREGNNFRWKMNGMREDDVGIVSDTDETFTRYVPLCWCFCAILHCCGEKGLSTTIITPCLAS